MGIDLVLFYIRQLPWELKFSHLNLLTKSRILLLQCRIDSRRLMVSFSGRGLPWLLWRLTSK